MVFLLYLLYLLFEWTGSLFTDLHFTRDEMLRSLIYNLQDRHKDVHEVSLAICWIYTFLFFFRKSIEGQKLNPIRRTLIFIRLGRYTHPQVEIGVLNRYTDHSCDHFRRHLDDVETNPDYNL